MPSVFTGSTAVGLALVHKWGHECPDLDAMILYGAELGVCVTKEHQSIRQQHSSNTSPSSPSSFHANSCLEYDSVGCLSAYTRLGSLITCLQGSNIHQTPHNHHHLVVMVTVVWRMIQWAARQPTLDWGHWSFVYKAATFIKHLTIIIIWLSW